MHHTSTTYPAVQSSVTLRVYTGSYPFSTLDVLVPSHPMQGVIEPAGDVDDFTIMVPADRAL